MKNLLAILFVSFLVNGFSQIFPGGNIEVTENGQQLANPWAGGLDLPQFSATDLDFDGKEDLVIFDKKGNKWLVYLNQGNAQFKYAPQYEKLFPEVINLALLRDFNCDGYADIFAHTNFGIQVFKNTHQGGNPSFVLEKSILKYEASWGMNNIYKFNNDIPAIEDFDGDGDIDILSFDLLGTTIPYYKNLSVENGFSCDSFIYEESTVCWGHFKESNSDNSVQLNFMCKGNGSLSSHSSLEAEMHTGSTLAVLDEDNDGDKDLLLGDVAYDNLIFLKNGGTNFIANMVSVETDFPAYNTPIKVPIFPASFYVDVNNDGQKDLLVSPNSYTSAVNKDCVWYYENTGNANAKFSLKKRNFLVETQIDYGSYSNVTFFDHNADGLLDMIIGNGFIYDDLGGTNGSLYYYENTGTATKPAFTLMNENYGGVANFGLEYMKPTFGDIDGDGDDDMIIGAADGALHLFNNNGGAGNSAIISFTSVNYFNIDIGTHSTPQLVDLNEDGLLDLIIGRNAPTGNVAYYRNFGTATNAQFHPDTVNPILGGIHVENPGFLFGYSAPFVAEEDIDGNKYIYVGSDLGFIHKYKVNVDSLENGAFEEIDDAILEVRAGKRTTISVVDINNDGQQDYFVGNSRGGVHFYSDVLTDTSLVLGISKELEKQVYFELFPNPVKEFIQIEIDNSKNIRVNVELKDVLGKTLLNTFFTSNTSKIDVSNFSKGIYFISLRISNKVSVQKIVIE